VSSRLRIGVTAVVTPLVALSAGLFAAGGSAAAPTALAVPGGRADQHVIIVLRDQLTALPASVASIGARRRSVESAQAPIVDALRAAGTSQVHSFTTVNALSATISLAAEQALRADPAVAEIVPDAVITAPTNPAAVAGAAAADAAATGGQAFCAPAGAAPQLNPEALQVTNTDSSTPGAKTARSLGFTGAGVKVAFMAEGIDVDNPDFIRADGSHVFVDYKDFSGDGLDAPTTGGEAFLDASSIAAQGRETYDVSHYSKLALSAPCRIRIEGVAPGASLVGLKIFATQHVTYESGILQAIDYAVAVDHVDVLNESFGGNPIPDSTQDVTKAFDDAAVAAGTTVVVSSGDAGSTNTIGSPATDPKVIDAGATTTFRSYVQTGLGFTHQVGATGYLDNNISSLSSGGVTEDGRTVDLVAPGDLNWTLCTADVKQYADCTNDTGAPSSVMQSGGTSEAAPLTAGAAALVIQAYKQSHHGARPSPALIKEILTGTATDISAPADQQGAGLINSYKAVEAAMSAPGSTRPAVGQTVLTSADQIDDSAAPGTAVASKLTLTNVGAATQHVVLGSRALGTYRTLAQSTVKLSDAASAKAADTGGHTDNYVVLHFKVPAGLARLDASIAYQGSSLDLSSRVRVTVFDPKKRLAGYSLPQGVGNYGDTQVARPVAGTWTALISSRITTQGGTAGPVVFGARGATFTSTSSVSPQSVVLAPGKSTSVTFSGTTPGTPGDAASAITLTSTAGGVRSVSTVPVILRSVEKVTAAPKKFVETLRGGNGRSTFGGVTGYFKLQVPAGLPELNSLVQLSGNKHSPFTASLISPTGQALAFASSQLPVGIDSSGNLVAADVRSAQLHVLKPVAGRWALVVNFAPTVSGVVLSEPYTVETDGRPVAASAKGLPTSATTKIATGHTRTVQVRVHNGGSAPEAFFLDARRNASVTYALDVSPSAVTLPDTGANGEPLFFVPTDTTSVGVKLAASGPVTFDYGYNDPDLSATTQGRVASGSISGDPLVSGLWFVGPSEIGPYGDGVPPTITGTVSATAKTAMFDPTLKSATGDLWLDALNQKAAVDPVLVLPGQTKTILVKITPTGKAGTKIAGTLYVDDISEVDAGTLYPGGQQVAALPYRYTIG
jgi:hypothetical protein